MKKIIGILLVVVCSSLIFLFAVSIFIVLTDTDDDGNTNMTMTLVAFVVPGLLLVFGIVKGSKMVKENLEPLSPIIPFNETMEISVSGKIGYEEYRNFVFSSSYRNPLRLVIIGVAIMMGYSIVSGISQNTKNLGGLYLCGMILGFFVLSPILTLYQIKKIYATGSIFKEVMQYRITNESIHLKGDTLDASLKWAVFYRVRETKDFFAFYQNRMVATLVSKKMLSENEIQQMKRFIQSLPITRG